jgi:hypothetical protein
MKTGIEENIPIKKFEIQYTPFPFHPRRRQRKNLYIFDFNDKEVKEKINIEEIDGDETDGEEADENINMKKIIEKIIEKIGEKFVRIYSKKKMKRARISLPYYGEMEDRRIKNLEYKIKLKIARRQRS